MTIQSITFVHPLWLAIGSMLALAVVLLGVRLDRQRRLALAAFGSRRLGASSSLSRARRLGKRALVAVGLLSACVALARPQRGSRWEETQRRGIDLLFAVDTSKSMLAPDVKPNRLVRAKLAIADLVGKFEGDRVGLVAFAGEAFLQCPLTLDRDMFTQTLDAVDTSLIARGGTDVGRAIEVAQAALKNEPANQKILVLLTDGEDLEAHAVAAARAAAGQGVRIYTVGVGTESGELIPLTDGHDGAFVRDEAGAFVRSRLDDKALAAIAGVTGGDYRRLGADGRGLEALYHDVLSKLPRETLGSRIRQVPLERFQWPLALSMLCLGLEPLIRERRRRRVAAEPPMRKPKLVAQRRRAVHATVAVTLALAFAAARPALASPTDAARAYHAGKFVDAAKAYQAALSRSPDDARLQFNAGAAAYKAGDVTQANAAFEKALRSERLDLQQKAYYDLGNTLYRGGQKTIDKEPQQTIEAWKRSIASYESALKLDGKDGDAVFNRDLVKRKLAELEQQQQQQQQKQQQSKNQKDQQDKQGKQDKQAQNQKGNGQPQQNQPGQQDKQAQNQKGNGQPQQNQQGQQDKNQQANGQQGQQQQQAQQQAQQQQAQQQPGEAAANGARANEARADAKDDVAAPGRLSRNDAKALLDALRGDERLMPMAATNRTHAPSQDDVVKKDW